MQEWMPLQDICEITQGVVLSRLRDQRGEPFKVIQIRNLNALELDDPLEVERLSPFRARSVKEGDVLLSLRGSPIRAAVVPEGMKRCVASPNIAVIRPKGPKLFTNDAALNPYYLAGLLSSEYMNRILDTYLGGGAVPSLSVRTLRMLKVPVPMPDLQEDFAEAFKAHNRASANAERLVARQRERLEAELIHQFGEDHAH